MKKRALSWLLALTMLLTLAPQTLPVWASATGEKSNTATQTESKLSANTYSALGLSRSIKPSDEGLDQGKQPYGDAVEGNTVATNVINELYVNFNGSIHYGWSILDNIPMEYRDNSKIGTNWKSKDNSYGAMGYWRSGASVDYENGNSKNGALFAKNGSIDDSTTYNHVESGSDINSANKHIVYQYSKSEAFSPNTGKDNYVAELVVDDNGDVHLYLYQVEGGNKRYVRGTKIGHNPFVGDASNKTNVIWNWEYDAMFDIAAGDMDGDGYDEIAVYTATGTESDNKQEVHLYRYEGGALTEITTQAVTKPNNGNASGQKLKLGTAVVTLAFGDLNADDKDELVIAENMGYGASNIADGKVRIYALQKNNELKQQKEISLKIQEQGSNLAMARYANVATGDIDNDNQDELVIAGYPGVMGTIAGTAVSGINGDYISYNIIDGKDYRANGWETVTFDKKDLLGRVVDNNDQLIPPVSLTCAATQGVGYAEQVFLSGCLYSVDTSKNSDNTNKFSLEKLTEISTNREYKKDNGKKANKEEIFVVNVVAGNFNGNRNGQEQIVYAFGMKHDDSDRYWYDIGYINKKNPGNSDSDYWYGQEQVMNFESSYNRDSNKRRASLYLSLAAVDCDNDSTLMRYKGQEVTWTKPEVLTVLQSAPYFQDLQDTRDYLDQSQTAYGKGNGITSSATAGGGLSIGTYVSFEQDFSVFGVKIASIEAEAQSKHSFNYSFESSRKKEISVAYSGSAGDNYAIVYAVPFMEYQYETWVPGYKLPTGEKYIEYLNQYLEEKLGTDAWDKLNDNEKRAQRTKAEQELGIHENMDVKGSWQPSTVSVPMTPRTVILSVDSYDEIATQTEGLEPIRGNVLNSTPGDPSSYTKIGTSNGFKVIGKQQTVTNAEGSNTQIEGVNEQNQEHNFEYSYEFEAKAGVGAGGLTVGVLAGFEANAGGGTGKSESKTYTATVDNLPKDATGYTFDWQFGTREAELNGNPVLVLEYQLDNVNQLPSPPRNLRVEAVTSDSVTLQWDAIPGAGSYEIYQITSAGKKILVDTVPGTATSYTDTSVDPNNSYTYCMKNITKGGTASIFSTKAEAYTLMQNSGKFIIKKQPGENNTFSTYIGGTATATVQAEYLDQDGNEKKIHYTWEKYDTKSKEWVDYARGNTISISQVKDEMDGDKFRCQVYYNANLYIYTEPLTLEVGQAKSTTTLSSEQAGTTVNASYVETNEVKTGETKEVPVEVTVRNKKYTVYTTNDATVYLGEDGKYYSINGENATEISEESKNVQLTYTIKTGTGENTTEELKTISFDQLDPDTTFNGTTTPAVTYEYRDEESETAKTIYTANEKYTYAGHPTVEVYNCHENATEDKPASDFWFVKIGESKYAADVETTIVLKINDSKRIDVNDLVQSTTKEDATKSQQTYVEGTTVTLTANVNDANEGASDKPTGNVVFKIVNSVGDGSGTVTGTIGENGVATATWKPSVAGVYTITAAYEGSEIHMGSASAGSITINVVVPGEKKLVIDSPNSMTYGDAAIDLKATLLSGAEGSGTGSAAPATATYSVKDAAGNTVSNAIADNKFAPKAAGNYTITATCTVDGKSFTATKTINVSKRTVKIVPKVENNVTSYTLENIVSADDSLFKGKINVTCAGATTGAAAGQYPINVTYTPGTDDNAKTIDSRYLVILDTTQVYTVSDDVVKVTNATNSNSGTVTLQYIVNGVTYTVGSDGVVPKKAKLVAYANPKKGYQVEKWTINDNDVYLNGNSGAYNTARSYTVTEDVQENCKIKAEFKPVYYKLNFNVEGENGTVTANYWNGTTVGSSFKNGGELSPLHSVQLTANVPGKSITGWKITQNGTDEIVKVDGTTYTGSSYILTSISADTTVTVLTEVQEECTVKVSLVNADGTPLVNDEATVSFSPEGTKTTPAANGVFTYNGHTHDNLTVTLTLPDGLIVNEWVDDAGKALTDGNLSGDKKTWDISNLSKSFAWTVKCSTPNSFRVTTDTQLNGQTSTEAGTISVYKAGQSEEQGKVNSGDTVLQASSLRVVITPNSGYQLWNVTCNEKSKGVTSDFTINGVNEDINIVANFVKKPVITITAPTNGKVTASGMPITNSTVPYGSKDNIVFTATPVVGYEVGTWKVKVGDADPTTLTSDQIKQVANSDNQTYTYTPDATTGITSDVTVEVSFKALPKATVEFSVVDKNNETDGGFDGTIQATVTRNGQSTTSSEVTSGTLTNVYRDSKVTFAAEPAAGYKVTKWLLNGEEQTTSPVLDIGEEDNDTTKKVQVQFEKISNEITYAIDPTSDTGHGATLDVTFLANTGTSSEAVKSGNSVTTSGVLTVTVNGLNDGYEIESWTLNGAPYTSTDGKLTCNVSETQGADIKVTIVRKSYQITFSATEGGTITAKVDETTLTSPASVKGDKQVTFTASTPETGYEFVGWKVDEKTVQSNSDPYVLTVSKNTSVQACYALTTAKYQVTYGIIQTSGKDNGTLAASGLDSNGKANAGSNITFTATPAAGYQVKQWYDAATSGAEIGVAENTTYEIKNLTANESVYVQFEPIPTYNITVNVSGQGSVTAMVNEKPATITNNTLEVKRHDSVVLTAEPEAGHHLKEWTGGTVSQENPRTLTLSDVTDHHTIAANFEVNQGVPFKTECGTGGSLEAKAGYGNNLQPIKADTGIQVDNGKKIVLTAKPDNDKAVVWTVNNQPTNELSNTYTIDAISENTTVKANFVTLELCTIPTDMSNDTYSISSVTKYPADYGEANQIRKGGTLSFKLTPKKPVMGLQGLPDNAQVVYNSDGSYTVTVTNVISNIAVTATAYQVEAKGLNDYEVPPSLKDPNLNSITDIETKLKTTLTGRKDGIVFYDIVLKASDGTPVTTFPANGVYVTIPYPDGTNKQDTFRIVHMLTVDMNGKKAGEVEEITPITKGENGISFHVTSLSPFAIGWTKYVAPTPGGGGGGGGGAVSTCTLTFDTNGGSAIDKITKDSGTTIDLAAYKPTRAGYTFTGWFSDKALTKAVTSVKLTANTTVYAKWTQNGGTAQNPFVDVKEGAYYYDAVLWAVEQKITSGTSATTFSPDASCTRAQMVTFLWRAAGSPKVENGKNPFADVQADAYYYDAVLWAVEKGVTSGTSATTFSPDATVTRGQTVTFLYRNAGSPEVSGTMPFTDVEADAYYAKAVQWAVQQKITTGTSETTFSPMSDCTRGQIVTFLYRAK